jgi:response regulator RpfG family c-di-GMP phosphodiesterase
MKQLAAPFHACTPKQENPVSGRLEKAPTVLHFSCNPSHLLLHRSILTSNGFCVLDESNGFEAIRLSTLESVDAVVLHLDGNQAEITVIARQIKKLRPQVTTILLTENTAPADCVHTLVDRVVRKGDGPETLMKSLVENLSGRSDRTLRLQ